jgi:hypothetical protein
MLTRVLCRTLRATGDTRKRKQHSEAARKELIVIHVSCSHKVTCKATGIVSIIHSCLLS